jgi:hypothetical protein
MPAPELHPLHLSDQDRADLVAFLRSLTGKPRFPVLHTCPRASSASCNTNPVTYQRTAVPDAGTDGGVDLKAPGGDAADAPGESSVAADAADAAVLQDATLDVPEADAAEADAEVDASPETGP